MKKNNKAFNNNGFMLLETLIVSTVVLGTLVFLYIQFVNVKSNYEVSFKYNTIPGLFMAKEVANYLSENGYLNLQDQLDNKPVGEKGYINITDATSVNGNSSLYNNMRDSMKINYILFVNDDLDKLKNHLSNEYEKSIFTEPFRKYILRLNTDKTKKYRIIVSFQDDTYASVLIGGNA